MFVAPVSVTEMEQVIKSLKSNSSTGFDEILMSLVQQCLCYYRKPLVHIHNVSFQTGIFSRYNEKGKKLGHFLRKGIDKTCIIIDGYPSYQSCLKS